ncbi:DUF6287 domain-containing protein [Aerococcus urinae]
MKKRQQGLLYLTTLLTLFLVGCQNSSSQTTETSESQESVSSKASSEKEEAKEKESSKEESESKKKEEEKAEIESETEEAELESSANESTTTSLEDQTTDSDQQGIDIDQIQQGDLTTLVGTWRNGKGQELIIHEDGSVYPDQYINLDNFRLENQTLVGDLRSTNSYGGAALSIIPAGVVMKAPMLSLVDASDNSRDRLLATQTYGTMEIPEEFYYRVD